MASNHKVGSSNLSGRKASTNESDNSYPIPIPFLGVVGNEVRGILI